MSLIALIVVLFVFFVYLFFCGTRQFRICSWARFVITRLIFFIIILLIMGPTMRTKKRVFWSCLNSKDLKAAFSDNDTCCTYFARVSNVSVREQWGSPWLDCVNVHAYLGLCCHRRHVFPKRGSFIFDQLARGILMKE